VPDISLPAEWFGWLAGFPDIYSWIPWFAQAVSPKDSKMNLLKVSLLEVCHPLRLVSFRRSILFAFDPYYR